MGNVYVLNYSGELSIKSRGTRNRFSRRLVRNLGDALESAEIPHEIRRTWARVYIESDSERVAEVASRVFGVMSVTPAIRRRWEDLDDLLRDGSEIFTPVVAGKTFAVRVRRGGSRKVGCRSPEIERRLGSLLLPHSAGVDLGHPQVEVRLELRGDDAYYSSESTGAHGGLPMGTEGRAISLFSGGFDSAVASWLLLRRGVQLEYLFLNLAGESYRESVLRVLKVLSDSWSFGYRPYLHMVDFEPVMEEIRERCPQRLWQVVLKRQMLRAADRVARQARAAAIVTGEAVGQVSSQTLQNLAVISEATSIPILRPLVASHKEEILAIARRIGTYEPSAKVPELCAMVPREPETHAKMGRVVRAEEGLDPTRIEALVDARAMFDLRALDLEKIAAPGLEVDRVPEGAVLIDLRSMTAYKSWHYPGALRLSYVEALKAYRSFDRGKTYVFYCEVGLKSAHLAELMHEEGVRAHHFAGGLKWVVRYAAGEDELLRAVRSPVLLSE